MLPAFAFLTVSWVSLIAVTVPPNTSFVAGRAFVVGLLADAVAGAAIAPVVRTAAITPAAANHAKSLPIMVIADLLVSKMSDASVGGADEGKSAIPLNAPEKAGTRAFTAP